MNETQTNEPCLRLEDQLCFPLYACAKEVVRQYREPLQPLNLTYTQYIVMMVTVRTNNQDVAENIEVARSRYGDLKFGETVKMQSMDDYEALRLQVLARNKSVSRRKFIRQTAGSEVKLNSNGETALEYFNSKLKNDTLYCLDEPENSLSPKLQIELKNVIEEKAHYCGCQFIIATHSPFLLAMREDFTTIYDLDRCPVETRNWWELENTKTYFEFFKENRELFLK